MTKNIYTYAVHRYSDITAKMVWETNNFNWKMRNTVELAFFIVAIHFNNGFSFESILFADISLLSIAILFIRLTCEPDYASQFAYIFLPFQFIVNIMGAFHKVSVKLVVATLFFKVYLWAFICITLSKSIFIRALHYILYETLLAIFHFASLRFFRKEYANRMAWFVNLEASSTENRARQLLVDMMPNQVLFDFEADKLKLAYTHENVTFLFADICGFTAYAKSIPAKKVGQVYSNHLAAIKNHRVNWYSLTRNYRDELSKIIIISSS